MYTIKNYRTKKELVTDFKAGEQIEVYQPGPFGGKEVNGNVCLEGPHYPQPHKWYAGAVIEKNYIVKIK